MAFTPFSIGKNSDVSTVSQFTSTARKWKIREPTVGELCFYDKRDNTYLTMYDIQRYYTSNQTIASFYERFNFCGVVRGTFSLTKTADDHLSSSKGPITLIIGGEVNVSLFWPNNGKGKLCRVLMVQIMVDPIDESSTSTFHIIPIPTCQNPEVVLNNAGFMRNLYNSFASSKGLIWPAKGVPNFKIVSYADVRIGKFVTDEHAGDVRQKNVVKCHDYSEAFKPEKISRFATIHLRSTPKTNEYQIVPVSRLGSSRGTLSRTNWNKVTAGGQAGLQSEEIDWDV